MLAKRLDNEEVNQLPAVLQEPAMASVLKVLSFVSWWVFCLVFCHCYLVFKFSGIFIIVPNTHLFHIAYLQQLRTRSLLPFFIVKDTKQYLTSYIGLGYKTIFFSEI